MYECEIHSFRKIFFNKLFIFAWKSLLLISVIDCFDKFVSARTIITISSFRSASCIYFTLGSHENHIWGYILLDDQCEASLVSLYTSTYDALYFGKHLVNAKETRWAIINLVANKFTVSLMLDKFRALHQHRESTAGKTQVHHVGGNAEIQVSFMWKVIEFSIL